MLAQTFTGIDIPKTGNPEIDAFVAKVVLFASAALTVLGVIGYVWGRLTALRDAIFATATAIETSTNGELEALLAKNLPGLPTTQISALAKAVHFLVTSRVKAANVSARTEPVMNKIVTAAKDALEESKKAKELPLGTEGRARSAWLAFVTLIAISALSVGCASTSIPQAHLDADTAFLDAIEPDYFYLLKSNGELQGETVTADLLDLKQATFRSFRTALKKANEMREAGNK